MSDERNPSTLRSSLLRSLGRSLWLLLLRRRPSYGAVGDCHALYAASASSAACTAALHAASVSSAWRSASDTASCCCGCGRCGGRCGRCGCCCGSGRFQDYIARDCEFPPSQNPIFFDNTGLILNRLGLDSTILGVNVSLCDSAGPVGAFLKGGVENPVLTHSYMVLNGTVTGGFGSTLIHEVGHLIGLDHTQVNLHVAAGIRLGLVDGSYGPLVPIMYWADSGQDNTLKRDDIAWISELYPQPFFSSNTGRISGKVFRRIGTPFPGANVVAVRIDPDSRESLSETVAVVSDYLLKGDGSFELPGLTPGDYVVFIEPLWLETLANSVIGDFGKLGRKGFNVFTKFPKDYYNRGVESGSVLLDDPSQRTMITIGAGETSLPIDLISNEDANRLDLMVGDDEYMLYEFPEGFLFPFYGTNYHAAMVHTDGNITFRGEDPARTPRDEQRFLSGFPRIAPLFADLDPTQGGTVRAEFDSTDRIMRFHWENVPQFSESGGRAGNTFSVSLFPTGNVHFGYGAISLTEAADGTEAVVGLSRGGSAPSKTVDLSESPTGVIGVGSESIYEKFPSNTNFDLHTTNIRELLFVVDEAPKGELTASPNPVSVCDGSDLGRTTLSWSIPGTEAVEIRIGSPVGSLVGGGGSSGSIETGSWVKDGMAFYLVDSKDRSVLASEVVHVNSSGCGISLTATPVQTCANVSSVTLTWASPSTNTVEIRVGSPGGPLVFGGITGSKQTGNWVTNGMTFYMVNANNKRTLAKTTVSFDRTGCRASLSANPNPIQVCDGSGVGQTTLTWELGSSSLAEIIIGSPNRIQGKLLGQWRTNGSISIPKWVSNGMAFYLVDSINRAVLASETVFHTTQNCPENRVPSLAPNLTPFRPSGWSSPIVVSTISGTTTDSSTFSSTDKLFVDVAVINNGTGATDKRFWLTLSVDGQEVKTWFIDPPLNTGFFANVKDYALGPLSAGTHTLTLVADSTSQIVESNESDNEFTKTITISQAATDTPPPPTRGSSPPTRGSGF